MKHCIRAAVFVASIGLSSAALAQNTGAADGAKLTPTEQAQRDASAAEQRAGDVEIEAQQRVSDAEQRALTAEEKAAADTEAARQSSEAARQDSEAARRDSEAARQDAAEAEQRAAAAEAAAETAAAEAAAAAALLAEEEEVDPGYYEGRWVGALGISGSFNLTSLSRVPGAPKGVSVGVNLAADGVLDYLKAKHEWRNTLTLGAGLLRSASDSIWVKTNDILKIQSGYYYAVTPWFGPFAEFQFQTAMFPMHVRRNGDANFCAEGTALDDCAAAIAGDPSVVAVGDSLKISGAFQPVAMHEKFGLFIRPVDRTYFRMALRTGFAAQQFYAKSGTYVETNRNAAGDAILIRELHTYGLFGFMADLSLRGSSKSAGILYGANAALLLPIADTSKSRRRDEDINGTQADLGAFVTFKISDWASLDVRGGAARVPQVTGNKWQTSIQTLLTFSYAVVGDLDTAREDATMLRQATDMQAPQGLSAE